MTTGWRTPSDWPATPTGLTGEQVEEALAELGGPRAATATALHPRLALLLALIDTQRGEWTTARVGDAYAAHDYWAPKATTHSHDLERLTAAGFLDRHEDKGRTYYTLKGTR